jgi:hypothetical protein
MVSSEDIRGTAIKFFSVTNYLKEGFVVVRGKKMDGQTDQSYRFTEAVRGIGASADKRREVFDLNQAMLFVTQELGKGVCEVTDFEKTIYEVWLAKSLDSAAHMLAERMEADYADVVGETVEGEEVLRWGFNPLQVDEVYRSIKFLLEYLPHNMGNLNPLRRRVGDRTKDDFAPNERAKLKDFKWAECRFQKNATFELQDRHRSRRHYDEDSIFSMSSTDFETLGSFVDSRRAAMQSSISSGKVSTIASGATSGTQSK